MTDAVADPALDASESQRSAVPVLRPGARVLVIDAADRVLLFSSVDDEGRPFWFPPGGGSEPGETAEQTASRELCEETGLTDVEIGPELWRRRWVGAWGGVVYDCRERWFLAPVSECEIDTTSFTELERTSIVAHRWWTLPQLMHTADRLVPSNLAALVRDFLRDGPPRQPFFLDG
jgi:8-oxo-dGTP pyrophosphatase MutT (NUDIX family)